MNKNIQHEFFIWEEKNLTDQNQNSLKSEKSVKESSIIETKNDLTQKDWKDITDPKLRRKAYIKAYNDSTKNKRNVYNEVNKERIKQRKKVYNEVNKEKIKLQTKFYRETNKNKIKLRRNGYHKNYYKNNKEMIIRKRRVYVEKNRNKIRNYHNSYCNRKFKTDIQFKLSTNLRTRLNTALKSNYKSGSAVKDLGCTIEEFKVYLESKFQPGMTWDNWTKDGWHIDHIKPLASFDLTDRNQLLEACHYTNLQPLWSKDNLSKGDNIVCKETYCLPNVQPK